MQSGVGLAVATKFKNADGATEGENGQGLQKTTPPVSLKSVNPKVRFLCLLRTILLAHSFDIAENFLSFVEAFDCVWRKNLKCDAILEPFMWNLALPWGFTAIFHNRGNMAK